MPLGKNEIDFHAGVTLKREVLADLTPDLAAARKIVFEHLVTTGQKPNVERATAMILQLGCAKLLEGK